MLERRETLEPVTDPELERLRTIISLRRQIESLLQDYAKASSVDVSASPNEILDRIPMVNLFRDGVT